MLPTESRSPLRVLAFAIGAYCGESIAQHQVIENVVTQAEDAFGVSLGRESIGLYDPSNVRGFSPTAAGNARIDGLYFDQVWGISRLLRDSTTVRIGISAFGFPFPAPTGVVDYRLRRPGSDTESSTYYSVDSYYGAALEYRRGDSFQGGELATSFNLGLYNNEFVNGTDAIQHIVSAQLLWQPRADLELQPFFARSDVYDDEVGPLFVPDGDRLPPQLERRQFRGPVWANNRSTASNVGLLAAWRPSASWTVRAGLFRSEFDDDVSHSNLIVNLLPDRTGRQVVSADPSAGSSSTSGEARVTHTVFSDKVLHQFHASLRGRERRREFGGAAVFDLGPIALDQTQDAPRPRYVFSEKTRDAVDQWFAGIAYEARWRDLGEVSVGLAYTDYRKSTAVPGEALVVARDNPLLWNASIAINLSSNLVLFGGATRGLEESGVAPTSAANRNTALPAIETEQVELGLRWRITPELRLIGGAFEVKKPYFNLDEADVWRELGDVRNRGIELSLTGEVSTNVSIVAGAVLLDADVTGGGVALGRIGSRPVGSTPVTILLGMDWSPEWLEGGGIDFGATRRGEVVATRSNRVKLPGRSTLDVGFRRSFSIGSLPTVLRLRVLNVTDADGFELQGAGAYGLLPGRVVNVSLSVDM